MIRTIRLYLSLTLALSISAVHGLAATPLDERLSHLTPSGPINDFAGILSAADRQTLLDVATSLEKDTSAQLAVVTLRSLEGGAIDDFALKLFAKWGIGRKERNNGVLVLVAMDDRMARIEVGYGLEGVLTDARARFLLENTLFPAFRQNRHGPGLIQTASQIAAIVRGDKTAMAATMAAPSVYTRNVIATILFSSIFVSIGTFLLGAGLGVRQFGLCLSGFLFGGFAFLIDAFAALRLPLDSSPINSVLLFCVHIPLALLMLVVGYRVGKKHPDKFRSAGRRSGGRGWSWSAGAGSSGGSSGHFGGGSSGGGGASGHW